MVISTTQARDVWAYPLWLCMPVCGILILNQACGTDRQREEAMSAANEINRLIDQVYTIELLLKSFHAKPRSYDGLTIYDSETHTLKIIAENEGISQTQLSERTFRTKGATSLMVDKLIEKGLIRRQRTPDDQRRYFLALTDKGRAVHLSHLAYDKAHAEMVAAASGIGQEDLKLTNGVLERLITFYEKYQQAKDV